MFTKKIASALAIAFALGFAAPAIADDPGGDPADTVIMLTDQLGSQSQEATSGYIEDDSSRG